jgi:hypothetical protein
MNGFKVVHDKLKSKENNWPLQSDNYTCHAWDQASKLVVCTEMGEIVICDYNGMG